MTRARSAYLALIAVLLSPMAAQADVIFGEFWDVAARSGNPITSGAPILDDTGGSYLANVDAIIAGRAADATFHSTGIAYPSDGGSSSVVVATLGEFLGADAATLTSGFNSTILLGSIIRLTGVVDLMAGNNVFDIFSDDGFRLSINGTSVASFDALRPPSSSLINYNSAGGLASFELIYFESQQVLGALTARLNGNVIRPVPEPGTLALLGFGLLGLGLSRRRKKV